MPRLFRLNPPIELVNKIVQTCGVQSIHDTTWFSKQHIQLNRFENYLPELEPYYIPCKAEEYLYALLTLQRCITILRQILRPHQTTLVSKEKTRLSEKEIWYQLQPCKSCVLQTKLDEEVSITFN